MQSWMMGSRVLKEDSKVQQMRFSLVNNEHLLHQLSKRQILNMIANNQNNRMEGRRWIVSPLEGLVRHFFCFFLNLELIDYLILCTVIRYKVLLGDNFIFLKHSKNETTLLMFLHLIIAYSITAMVIILLSDFKSLFFLSVVLNPCLQWLQAAGCSDPVPKRSPGKIARCRTQG